MASSSPVALGLIGLVAVASGSAQAALTSKTYASQARCEGDRAFSPAVCRTAFANALAEFAVKTPRYRSRRACFQRFGPCMPWPIGTHRFDEFRPQWIGVTIDMSQPEATATPALARGKIHLDFTPQSVSSLSAGAAAVPRPSEKAAGHAEPAEKVMQPDDDGGDQPASPPPPAGSGFTVIDGVLTYPAPARFQPKALKRQ